MWKPKPLEVLGGFAAVLGIVATVTAITRKVKAEPLDDDIAYPPSELGNSNISARQAMRRANQLYTAMKGAGTDEEAVYRAQNMLNGDGLKMVYNKFGIREGENLGQWFLNDLSDSEMVIVRRQWTERGIIPPF